MPSTGKRYFVFHDCMYSALPTKLMLRGTDSIRNAESRNEMWLGHRIAGPVVGQPLEAMELDVPEPAGERRKEPPGAPLASPAPVALTSRQSYAGAVHGAGGAVKAG